MAVGLGCARSRPAPPPPAAPPPPLAEEPLAPTTSAEFVVGQITETTSRDGTELYVEGTVRNIGSRASRDVQVTVEGVDADGRVVARAETLPTPQAIPPGTVATYVVRLPNDHGIKTVRVEAVGH
jgi:hypothetical protein